jgi:hypothetical protein
LARLPSKPSFRLSRGTRARRFAPLRIKAGENHAAEACEVYAATDMQPSKALAHCPRSNMTPSNDSEHTADTWLCIVSGS